MYHFMLMMAAGLGGHCFEGDGQAAPAGGAAPAPSTPAAPAVPASGAAPASPAAPAAPASGGQQTGAPASAPAPTADAGPAPAPTYQLLQTLNKHLRSPEAPAVKPEDAAKPLTRADLEAHQARVEEANAVRMFHEDVRNAVSSPTIFGGDLGITHVFTSDEQVNQFARSTERILSKGFSARQLILALEGEKLLRQAYEKGGRDTETRISKGRAAAAPPDQSGQPGGGQQAPKPTPKQDAEDRAETPNVASRKVESTGEILKRTNPEFYKKFMAGEVDLG